MAPGIEGEWLIDPQRDDGTLTNTPVLALLLLTATGGFPLLLKPVMGLRAQTAFSPRSARIGSLLTVARAGSLVGMLVLAVGPAMWGSVAQEVPAGPADTTIAVRVTSRKRRN